LPTAIILAGPNGAGKTTIASSYLKSGTHSLVFINADEIAARLKTAMKGAARDTSGRKVDDRTAR
jgi:predicted ABC-type ATPase